MKQIESEIVQSINTFMSLLRDREKILNFVTFIQKYKESKLESASANATSQSLYAIYQCYCKYAFDKEYNIISKRWFEKYFMSVYDSYLIDTETNANIIVSSKWFSI